jgi:hypothetical protein
MNIQIREILIMVAFAGFFSACLPNNLDKYRNKGKSDDETDGALFHPGSDIGGPSPSSSASSKSQAKRSRRANTQKSQRASIYAIDTSTFRFSQRENEVWDSALTVLLRNYNVTIVDRKSGILTTEWDSFYLKNEVFRNKVSIRLRQISYNAVDVTIHNNVEKLRDASQAAGTVGAVWLPAKDEANEVSRLVQNMALVLNQPPPVLPPGMEVAQDGSGTKASY